MILLSSNLVANEYYLSSSVGSDNNAGKSNDSPWKSFDRLKKVELKPGDKILLKSGDIFIGSISIEIQGEMSNPIIISNYGDGKNPANIIVQNLEIVFRKSALLH